MTSWSTTKASATAAFRAKNFDAAAALYEEALGQADATHAAGALDRARLCSNAAVCFLKLDKFSPCELQCTRALALLSEVEAGLPPAPTSSATGAAIEDEKDGTVRSDAHRLRAKVLFRRGRAGLGIAARDADVVRGEAALADLSTAMALAAVHLGGGGGGPLMQSCAAALHEAAAELSRARLAGMGLQVRRMPKLIPRAPPRPPLPTETLSMSERAAAAASATVAADQVGVFAARAIPAGTTLWTMAPELRVVSKRALHTEESSDRVHGDMVVSIFDGRGGDSSSSSSGGGGGDDGEVASLASLASVLARFCQLIPLRGALRSARELHKQQVQARKKKGRASKKAGAVQQRTDADAVSRLLSACSRVQPSQGLTHRMKTAIRTGCRSDVVCALLHPLGVDEAVELLCTASAKNAHELHWEGNRRGFTVCFDLSAINHSCWPNCDISFLDAVSSSSSIGGKDGGGGENKKTARRIGAAARFRTIRDIAVGEELTIAYVEIGSFAETRQTQLATNWGFQCRCRRCAAPKACPSVLDRERPFTAVALARGAHDKKAPGRMLRSLTRQQEAVGMMYTTECAHGKTAHTESLASWLDWLDEARAWLPRWHPLMRSVLWRTGRLHTTMGRAAEALPLLKSLLAAYDEVFPAMWWYKLDLLLLLAFVSAVLGGDHADAAKMYWDRREEQRRVLCGTDVADIGAAAMRGGVEHELNGGGTPASNIRAYVIGLLSRSGTEAASLPSFLRAWVEANAMDEDNQLLPLYS